MGLVRFGLTCIFLLVAALLEVGGDKLINSTTNSERLVKKDILLILSGAAVLGLYGFVVNLISNPKWWAAKWLWLDRLEKAVDLKEIDLTTLLGGYIFFFALVSFFASNKPKPASTTYGLVLIAIGGLIIQWGQSAK